MVDRSLEGEAKPMKVERHFIAEMSIYKFGGLHELTMEVHERPYEPGHPSRFYAHFKNAEVMENGCLVGMFGDGKSEAEAIRAYAKRISLRKLAVGAHSRERREIDVPRLA